MALMGEAKKPADLLGGILREVKAQAATARTSNVLAEVLGEPAASHCKVVSERGGRLLVDVDSAPVFSELQSFRREEIRQALNERLPERKFAQLSFRLHQSRHV